MKATWTPKEVRKAIVLYAVGVQLRVTCEAPQWVHNEAVSVSAPSPIAFIKGPMVSIRLYLRYLNRELVGLWISSSGYAIPPVGNAGQIRVKMSISNPFLTSVVVFPQVTLLSQML